VFLSASTNAICRHGGGRVGELGVGESSERFFYGHRASFVSKFWAGKGFFSRKKWEG
jgi:hypothetical protein